MRELLVGAIAAAFALFSTIGDGLPHRIRRRIGLCFLALAIFATSLFTDGLMLWAQREAEDATCRFLTAWASGQEATTATTASLLPKYCE